MITVKFGGTSLADAQRIRNAAQIIRSNPRRKYAVVSAPGKRFSADIKITDLLYKFQSSGDPKDFEPIEDRFAEIIRELEINLDLSDDFRKMKEIPHNADYTASCGEYLSAKIMAAYLGWPFVDAEDCIFFDENGQLDAEKTDRVLRRTLSALPCAVLPGFYGVMPDGQIHTFSRGGSDITGALVAKATDAEVYENWTDVDGMLVTDPRIVPEAATIHEITYAELRELAYQGATVLHEDAVLPAKEAGIPIHICNTFRPKASGSWILSNATPSATPVTGIAGRKGFVTIQIERERTNSIVGYVRRILSCLEKHDIPFEHMATGLGSVCLVAPSAAVNACREALEADIREAVNPDTLLISEGLAMIAVVGRGMIHQPGIAAKLFEAVSREKISVRVIDQGSTEMNIVIGVSEKDYEAAIRAIYSSIFDAPAEA